MKALLALRQDKVYDRHFTPNTLLISVHQIKVRLKHNASLVGLPLAGFTRLSDIRTLMRCYVMSLLSLIISGDKWTCSKSISMTQQFTYLPSSETNNRYFVAVLEG
jgi:hypothetical protein